MKGRAGIAIALGLFAASAGAARLATRPATAGAPRHSLIPAVSPGPAHTGPLSPDQFLTQLERRVTGDSDRPPGSRSGRELEQLFATHASGADDAILEYVQEWLREDREAASSWLRSHEDEAGAVIEVWAAADPDAALAAAARFKDPEDRSSVFMTAFRVAWRKDAARALALYQQNCPLVDPEKGYRPPYLSTLEKGEEEFAFLQSLPPGRERDRMLQNLWEHVWTEGGDTAWTSAYWKSQPEPVRQKLLAKLVIKSIVPGDRSDLPGAEETLRSRAESTGNQAEARGFVLAFGDAWAARDFPAALSWTREHVQGREGLEAACDLFRKALTRDFEATVTEWQALPNGVLKRKALAVMSASPPDGREAEIKALQDSLPPRGRIEPHDP
ncbi:MAG TPA: hypothetical protein VHM91_06565 [Verrucomicrobiales bacterium]|nr:hypothetical protein [Verrucomicrobiales bacterium]